MKLSHLIIELQNAKEQYGDIDVAVDVQELSRLVPIFALSMIRKEADELPMIIFNCAMHQDGMVEFLDDNKDQLTKDRH